jgi:opacity protein-like surface antigen
MKKLSAICLLFFTLNSFSQKLYADFSGGYNFVLGAQNLTSFNFNQYIGIVSPGLSQKVDVSLGKGVNLDASIGFNFKSNYSLEINCSYLMGSAITSTSEYWTLSVVTRTIQANMFRLNPCIILTTGNERLNPYMRIGAMFGFGKINYIQRDDVGDTTLVLYNNEFSGGWAFGMNAGIGLNYSINKSISLFGEANFITMSYAPTKGKVVEYISHTGEELDDLDIAQKEFEFLDEVEKTPYDPDTPTKTLKHSFPFGSIGVKVGLRISLWNGQSESLE